jgi:hypothetical protein
MRSARNFGRWILTAALLWLGLPAATHAGEARRGATLIPLDQLSETNRVLVAAVTGAYTLRRDYRPRHAKGREEDFEYWLDHVEASSVLAQKLGVVTYRVTLDEEGRIWADNHDGANGYMLPVYAAKGKRIYYVEGSQDGLFHVRGRGVAVIEYSTIEPGTLEYRATVFAKVDNAALAAMTRLFAIFLRGALDNSVDNLLRSPVTESRLALTDPQRLLDEIEQMPEDDRKLLDEFASTLRSSSPLNLQARAP